MKIVNQFLFQKLKKQKSPVLQLSFHAINQPKNYKL